MPAGRVPVKFTKELLEMYDEGYERGFRDGQRSGLIEATPRFRGKKDPSLGLAKPKRKLSAWQKYIKNKRNHIKFRDGKLNLKKMGVEFRKKKRR
tara:strand:+ start:387 stop:671 length:285 start_codon:yes stop_codon:yes gene_type:complete